MKVSFLNCKLSYTLDPRCGGLVTTALVDSLSSLLIGVRIHECSELWRNVEIIITVIVKLIYVCAYIL